MSCASSTTTKSKTTFLLFEITAASELNSSACVISFRLFNSARTRSKMDHNTGRCPHTASRRPWQLHVVIEFSDENRAIRFERYLKSGSGRAFAKRHFEQETCLPSYTYPTSWRDS